MLRGMLKKKMKKNKNKRINFLNLTSALSFKGYNRN